MKEVKSDNSYITYSDDGCQGRKYGGPDAIYVLKKIHGTNKEVNRRQHLKRNKVVNLGFMNFKHMQIGQNLVQYEPIQSETQSYKILVCC